MSAAVASFTDAWIETSCFVVLRLPPNVASFTDAWIETGIFGSIGASRRSHLLQMRGLKPRPGMDSGRQNRRIFYRCVD